MCTRSKAQNIFCIVNESTFNSFNGLCTTPSTHFHELCLCVNWILPLIYVKMPLFACFTFNFNAMFTMMLNDRIQSFCCNFRSKFLLQFSFKVFAKSPLKHYFRSACYPVDRYAHQNVHWIQIKCLTFIFFLSLSQINHNGYSTVSIVNWELLYINNAIMCSDMMEIIRQQSPKLIKGKA